jgi:hypothetical protein
LEEREGERERTVERK